MNIEKLDNDAILIDRYDDIEKISRKLEYSNLENAILVSDDATHCEIAEWLCESPIDAKGIIEEMEKLLNPPQKQLISFEKIPRNNIFEAAIVSDIDHTEQLTEILNIEGVEARKEKLLSFEVSILQAIDRTSPCFYAGSSTDNADYYNFAYPFSQFIKD